MMSEGLDVQIFWAVVVLCVIAAVSAVVGALLVVIVRAARQPPRWREPRGHGFEVLPPRPDEPRR